MRRPGKPRLRTKKGVNRTQIGRWPLEIFYAAVVCRLWATSNHYTDYWCGALLTFTETSLAKSNQRAKCLKKPMYFKTPKQSRRPNLRTHYGGVCDYKPWQGYGLPTRLETSV